ncbi:hypothetical protein F8154_01005 [Alkaliphilus pronyensis]|uniref:Uncharacterized protein n=1 Tax=Alkaliphilus pronyensis TaxID=1482732 RepID=A0A6I0FL12_9FIRM|nr:hypothetical protein F8154_01005 [Alkaliphilus pronyensis]
MWSMIIIIVAVTIFTSTAFSNSGPVYWGGKSASDILLVDSNSPITVTSENLTFDFSKNQIPDHTIHGEVTAEYVMVNPTNESQTVLMAFPFISQIRSLTTDDVRIYADDKLLDYDIYIGDIIRSSATESNKESTFSFTNIVNNITNEPYKAESFAKNERRRLYTFKVTPTTEERINFTVDFSFNHKDTKIVSDGFNRYERKGDEVKIAAWCYEEESLELFLLGKDVDFEVNAYSDGELSEETDLFTYNVTTEEVELESYIMDYIGEENQAANKEMFADSQIYNLYAQSLDELFSHGNGYCVEFDIIEQQHFQRLLTLAYTVEFPPNSEKKVSVNYMTTGTMDKTETVYPLYTFDYILNPAKNWRDFKNLNVKIIPHPDAQYLVESNIEFIKEENNTYTAKLENLPENDLTFTLYSDEEITAIDRLAGDIYNRFGYLTPIVIILIVLTIVTLIIVAIIRKKQHKA